MSPEAFERFLVLFSAGIGMLAVGGLNLLLPRAAGWGRGLVTLAACGLVLAGVAAVSDGTRIVATAGAVLALGLAPVLLAGSRRVGSAGAAVAGLVRRPAVRWAAVAVAGLVAVVGSAAVYEAAESAAIDREMAEMDLLAAPPPATAAPEGVRATTDRGTAVPLLEAIAPRPAAELAAIEERTLRTGPARASVIRRQPADDRTNCHGWVFTGGRYWVGGAVVDTILTENGYRPVTDPRPGDLAIYRAGGAVSHTALVRYVTPGLPVMVEGKWGCTGVFLHPVDKSCYGTEFAYYRSPRPGHLLTGLGGPSPQDPGRSQAKSQ